MGSTLLYEAVPKVCVGSSIRPKVKLCGHIWGRCWISQDCDESGDEHWLTKMSVALETRISPLMENVSVPQASMMHHFSLFVRDIMSSWYPGCTNFSSARNILSPQGRIGSNVESQYLIELLVERQNLEPLLPLFCNCSRFLDQEISSVSGRISNHGTFNDYGMLPFHAPLPFPSSLPFHAPLLFYAPSPVILPDMMLMEGSSNWNGGGWHNIQPEGFSMPQGTFMNWQSAPESCSSSSRVKKILRMDVPVDQYPNVNFAEKLLGPRPISLKRIEDAIGCRILICGRGSVRDQDKEERLRGQPGYEHLNEPLHIIIEAHSPLDVIDGQLRLAEDIIQEMITPVDASQEQLGEQTIKHNSTQG